MGAKPGVGGAGAGYPEGVMPPEECELRFLWTGDATRSAAMGVDLGVIQRRGICKFDPFKADVRDVGSSFGLALSALREGVTISFLLFNGEV